MAGTLGVTFAIGAHLQASVGAAFASLGNKMQALRQSFRNSEYQSTALGNVLVKHRELTDAMARAKAQMQATGTVEDSLAKSITRLAGQYGKAARAAGVYGESIAEISWRKKDMLRQSRLAQAQLRNMEAVQAGRDMRQSGREQRQSAIGKATTMAASMGALAQPVKIGMEFDAAMSNVAAVSKASGQDFDNLRKQALELGASTVWSSKQAAEGMSFLAMAGFKTNEVMAAMPGMLDLASAGGMELGATADIASNILSGFGMEAGKMGYVGDVLAKTFTNSNTTIAMLGESFKYCAPVAQAAGQSFQDVAAMIGKLGDAGIQGSMAGTGLNAIIGRMAKPPKEAATALAQLGVSVADAKGNMRALPDVFADIEKKMSRLSEQEQVAYSKMLYGAEHFSKGMVLQKQAVSGALQEMSAGLYEQGYASNTAKKMNDNLAGDLKSLASAYEAVQISISDAVSPALRQLTQHITPIVQNISGLIRENPRLLQGIVLIGGALAALKTAGIAFSFINSYRRTFQGGMTSLAGHVGGVVTNIGGAFGKLRSELAKPVSLSTKGASQGVTNLKTKFASLRSSISGTISKMREITPASVAAGAATTAAGAAAATGRAGFNMLRISLKGVGMAFKTMFGPMSLLMMALSMGVDLIMENWDKIKPYFEALWNGIKACFTAVLGWMQPIFDKIMAFIEPLLNGAGKVMSVLGSIWDKFAGNDKEKERKQAQAEKDKKDKEATEQILASLPPEARAQYEAQIKEPVKPEQGQVAVKPPVEAAIKTPAQQQPPKPKSKKQQQFEELIKQSKTAEDIIDEEADMSPSERAEAIEEAEAYNPPAKKKAKKSAPQKGQGANQAGEAAAPPQIIQPQVQVAVNVTQNGVPDQEFATGVMNAIRQRQAEFEKMISALVHEQARLAYSG